MSRAALLRDRPFRSFLGASTATWFGDRVTELALPLLAVVALDASATQVGLLTASVWAPNLLALLVGAWVDGLRRVRRLLVAADLLRAAVLLSVPLAAWLGSVTLPQLYAVALLTGAGQVLYSSAYPPFFVRLVSRERYVDANGLLSTSRSASFVAGPPAGGALVQALTAPYAVLVDAVTFLVSAVVLARIPVADRAPAPGPAVPLRARLRESLSYVRRSPVLRAALGCVTTVNLFDFTASTLLVLFATRELGLPPGLIGLALGLGALGGVAGAVLAPRLADAHGVGRVCCAGVVLFPASWLVVAGAGGPTWVAVLCLATAELVAGVGVMLLDVTLNAVQTAATADRVRSRVAGVFGTVNYGARPLGAVAGGVLADAVGVRPTLVLAGVGGALAVLWLLRSPVPGLRRAEDVVALA